MGAIINVIHDSNSLMYYNISFLHLGAMNAHLVHKAERWKTLNMWRIKCEGVRRIPGFVHLIYNSHEDNGELCLPFIFHNNLSKPGDILTFAVTLDL